jgi:REP element-mobilizing transposase RayT
MQHIVAHSVPPHWLIHDWHEALALWSRLLQLGTIIAAAIMPDHLHLVLRSLDVAAWYGCMSGYARWRNHHRGEPGRLVWLPAPLPEPVRSREHLHRSVRYLHLNPCRDQLVRDPLSWPFSTHRDAVGLGIPGVIATERNPSRFHAIVSSDPSVAVEGTELPYGPRGMRDHRIEDITAAVSALTRTTLGGLRRSGPGRRLLIEALVALTPLSKRRIARVIGVSAATVSQTPPIPAATLAKLERVLGDPRFGPLHDHDLTRSPAWRRYRQRRIDSGAYATLADLAQRQLRRRPRVKRPLITTG